MDTEIAVELARDGRMDALQRCFITLGFPAFILAATLVRNVEGFSPVPAPDVPLVALFILLAAAVYGLGYWRLASFKAQCESASLKNRMLHARLRELILKANYDGLTGYPNERLLVDRFNEAKARANRQKSSVLLYKVTLADMDAIIKYHGGVIGAQVIRQLGERLGAVLRGTDSIVRLKNSDYVLILESVDSQEKIDVVNQKIMRKLSADFLIEKQAPISAHEKVSMAQYPQDGETLEALMTSASERMATNTTLSHWMDMVVHEYADVTPSQFNFMLMAPVK